MSYTTKVGSYASRRSTSHRWPTGSRSTSITNTECPADRCPSISAISLRPSLICRHPVVADQILRVVLPQQRQPSDELFVLHRSHLRSHATTLTRRPPSPDDRSLWRVRRRYVSPRCARDGEDTKPRSASYPNQGQASTAVVRHRAAMIRGRPVVTEGSGMPLTRVDLLGGDRWPKPRLAVRPSLKAARGVVVMVTVQGEVVIERPREEVFNFVADGENEPRYNARMRVAKKITEGPIGAGTSFSQEIMGRARRVHLVRRPRS